MKTTRLTIGILIIVITAIIQWIMGYVEKQQMEVRSERLISLMRMDDFVREIVKGNGVFVNPEVIDTLIHDPRGYVDKKQLKHWLCMPSVINSALFLYRELQMQNTLNSQQKDSLLLALKSEVAGIDSYNDLEAFDSYWNREFTKLSALRVKEDDDYARSRFVKMILFYASYTLGVLLILVSLKKNTKLRDGGS
jgi:hypothetical protein